MTTLAIMGRSFEVAPFKLTDVRKAAPFIDAVNTSASAQVDGALSLGGMTVSTRAMIEVIAIAIAKVDPSVTADIIEDSIGLDDITSVGDAFKLLLTDAGLAPKGEATPPSEPATTEGEADLSNNLDSLSTN